MAVFKSIKGFQGYKVGDNGTVWSRKHGDWRKLKPCLCKGYPTVSLIKNGKGHTRPIHRLVLEEFVGIRPDGMECRHLDGDRGNNNLINICWGTPNENSQDKIKHGTSCKGSKHYSKSRPEVLARGIQHGQAKLNESEVLAIRREYATGNVSYNDLAKQHKMKMSTIRDVIKILTWRHI